MANLTLDQAEKWIAKACAKASQLGVKVSVVVVDSGGNPVALARMDGAGILSPDIARGKAYTAIAFKGHSKEMAERMKDRPAAGLGLTQASGNRVVLLPGGGSRQEGRRDHRCRRGERRHLRPGPPVRFRGSLDLGLTERSRKHFRAS